MMMYEIVWKKKALEVGFSSQGCSMKIPKLTGHTFKLDT